MDVKGCKRYSFCSVLSALTISATIVSKLNLHSICGKWIGRLQVGQAYRFYVHWQASKQTEQDTIRGVQIWDLRY